MENKQEMAKALLHNARRELAHVEGLIAADRGRATAGDVDQHKEKAEALRDRVDRLEAILGQQLARLLTASGPIAARDIVDWDRYRKTRLILEVGSIAVDDVDDLRIQDFSPGALPTGVDLLWSNQEQSIIAVAFEALLWSRAEAEKWLDEFMSGGKK